MKFAYIFRNHKVENLLTDSQEKSISKQYLNHVLTVAIKIVCYPSWYNGKELMCCFEKYHRYYTLFSIFKFESIS